MVLRNMTRREFAGGVLATLGAATLLRLAPGAFASDAKYPSHWPDSAPSRIDIAAADEPGTRLIVRGRVMGEDGRPVPKAMIYAYHTDSTGYYRADRRMPDGMELEAKLKGYVQADSDGRYEMDTIKPAPYPQGGNPSHIHLTLRAPSGKTQWETIWFEGDPLITADMRAKHPETGTFSSFCQATNQAGTLVCVRDFRLSVR